MEMQADSNQKTHQQNERTVNQSASAGPNGISVMPPVYGMDLVDSGFGVSRGRVLQTKLMINEPGDEYEQEADQVADQIMRMPQPQLQRKCSCGGTAGPYGECQACKQKRLAIQRKAVLSGKSETVAPMVHEVLRSPGQPLDAATRSFMERRFGHDFSKVQLHTDAKAAESARAVNALAYTVGRDVVFGTGQHAPQSSAGQRLLAHELAHVVQQSQGAQRLQRWAFCTPARPSGEDCPPRQTGEVQRARDGAMRFLSVNNRPLVFNFDIGSAAIKNSLHNSMYWKQFIREVAAIGSQWELLGFTDCQGKEDLNQKLREDRAAAVFNILPPQVKSQIVAYRGAPKYDCVTENWDHEERTYNRSVAFVSTTAVANMEAEEITACIPPPVQHSSGKRCKFYVYDSTEPSNTGLAWKVGARLLAKGRSGVYDIPSGDSIEEALYNILNAYASGDCGCTAEVQFWSHGSPGNAMSISKTGDELTISDFNIPELKRFGYGPRSMPGYREWHDKLSLQQRRLVLLRRTICDPDSEIYYRSCQAFQGKQGQEFAKASAEFWQSKVVGHTKVIALTQPGKKMLKPCQEPYWSESEGTETPTRKKPVGFDADLKPKKD